MKRFRHLDVPDHWKHYWSKYPEGYTVLEALLNWVRQVNDMTDTQNSLSETVEEYRKELDDFVEQFDDNLRSEVTIMLNDWYNSGLLAEIINKEVFDMKADTVDLEALAKVVGPVERLGENYRSIVQTILERAVNAVDFGVIPGGEVDTTAEVQAFVTYCEDNNVPGYFPANRYLVLGNVKTRTQPSYHYVSGLELYGSGKNTVFVGAGEAPINENSDLAPQCMFNIHSSNNIFKEMSFEHTPAPFYFGANDSTTAGAHSSFQIIEKIWMTYVGSGFVIEPDVGFYYNKIRDIHIAHFQTGVLMWESTWTTQPNANRNIFEGFRFTRGWLGFHVIGDGNTFIGCYGENISGNQAVGHRPYYLPDADPIRGLGGMYYFHDKGRNNRIIGGSNEDLGFDVYDEGYKNHYLGNRFEDFSATPKVHFPNTDRSPGSYVGEANKIGMLETAINSNSPWGTPAGVYVQMGRIFDKGYYRRPHIVRGSDFNNIHSSTVSRYSKLGRVLKWTLNMRFDLPDTYDINAPVHLEIPQSDKLKVEETYHSSTINVPMLIGGVWGAGQGTLNSSEPLKAHFENSGGIDSLVVYPPELGWRNDVNTNTIQFDLSINVEEI